ncbi:MAG: nucleotidyltransferase domain-containing protein [Desulfobacterales bacterium]|nr:nucleotidyltransferase domain-containing protein [Desulfobacterales bacterium]
MAEINPLIKKKVNFFLRKLNENGIIPEKVYLFGSYSNGKENPMSDIDVAVISSNLTDDRFNERIRLMKIACHIDSRIEPVPFNLNTFVEEDPLVWEILKTGILIHQRKSNELMS